MRGQSIEESKQASLWILKEKKIQTKKTEKQNIPPKKHNTHNTINEPREREKIKFDKKKQPEALTVSQQMCPN